ncbi:hypothetical protein D9M71_59210 [compost metagenome]
MRNVVAILQDQRFATACRQRGDALRVHQRAVLVLGAVDHQQRAIHGRHHALQRPVGELPGQPGFRPGRQHPAGLVAVVLLQARHLPRLGELVAGLADAVQRPVLHERLRRLGDQRPARLRIQRCAGRRHGAADAVAEGDEAGDVQLLAQQREEAFRLGADEVRRPPARIAIGMAEAEPVVGDHVTLGRSRELFGKIPPQLHAAQGVVEQHDGLMAGRIGVRPPAAGEHAARGCFDPVVFSADGAGHGASRCRWVHVPGFRRRG